MTPNTAAKNLFATNFATNFGTATLRLLDGAVLLAEHTLTGFSAPTDGLLTGNAIVNDTFLANGDIDSAEITDGTNTLVCTVGTSGAEVNVGSLTVVENGTSSVTSITVQY